MATQFVTVSIEIMHDKKLSANQKFILAEIQQLSSLEKGCIASNRHFAELTGISKSGVSNAIKDLESKGYIFIDNSKTKRNYGRVIGIHSGVPPIHSDVQGIHSGVETKGNITINKTTNKISEFKDSPDVVENNKKEKIPYQKIVDLYHDKLPELPKVIKLTPSRKRYLKNLYENELPNQTNWENFFAHVRNSTFLMGLAPSFGDRKPFIADLEWITKPANFVKIAEGKYHE